MVKSIQGEKKLPPDLSQVIDLLERHCLAPDGSLMSKSSFNDLQLVLYISHFSILLFSFVFLIEVQFCLQAREEMSKERLRYLEAMVIFFFFLF